MVFEKSTDGGDTWTAVLESYLFYETADFSALAIDPQVPTTVYAGTLGRGTFKSIDGGASWSTVLEPDRLVSTLAIDPQTQYPLCGNIQRRRQKHGRRWSAVLELAVAGLSALALYPQTPTTLYAGTSSGVVKSTDGGASWSTILESAVPGLIALAIDPVTPTTLYAATADGLFKSIDGGATWNPTSQSADVVAPDTTIGSVTDGNGASIASGAASLSRSVTFVFTGVDNTAVGRFECRMDATNFVACASPATYPNLTAGRHDFQVRAIDTSGNSDGSPARHSLTIDAPPETTINIGGRPSGKAGAKWWERFHLDHVPLHGERQHRCCRLPM